jgi:serine/threonine protein kinase
MPRFKEGDFPLDSIDLKLVELLGVGGFGEVWKATNPYQRSEAPVALKFCLFKEAAASLLQEVKLLDRVKSQGTHPGIVRLLRTYLRADPPCLEYEYIEGGDLGGLILEYHRTAGGIRPEKAAKLMLSLAEIVGYAHRLNPPIVHRDLKPANILVLQQDTRIVLKVTDFGIGGHAARQAIQEHVSRRSPHPLTLPTVIRGAYTPLYASPQQMDGEDADPRDDVYALGVIWHQLLTGDLEKGRPGGSRWKERLAEKGLTKEMVKLLERCFEEDPEDRPGDAADLAARLSGLLRRDPVNADAPGPKNELTSPARKVPVPPVASRNESKADRRDREGLARAETGGREQADAGQARPGHLGAKPPTTAGGELPNHAAAAKALCERGNAHFQGGDLAKAIGDYTQAIRLNPRCARAFNNRGHAYIRTGQHPLAIADLTTAIRLEPTLAVAYYNRGLAYQATGEGQRALADFRHAVELDPGLEAAWRANEGL